MSPRLPDDGASALLRGAARFLAVVVAAGAAGALIGVGLAALNRDDEGSTPSPLAAGSPAAATEATVTTTPTATATATAPAPATAPATATAPAPTTATVTTTTTTKAPAPASSGGKVRVDVLATIAHPVTAPAGDTRRRVRLSVHARVTNGTGDRIPPAPPVLLVGDARLRIAPGSSGAAGPLLAALDPGAVADGRLRFDTEGGLADQLTTTRVRLRIAGTTVALRPAVGSATAPG
jgi:pyruvate/2-oxoglutarate dehydrogenase complex dihydrolipoamide acyltransferase (E2) component